MLGKLYKLKNWIIQSDYGNISNMKIFLISILTFLIGVGIYSFSVTNFAPIVTNYEQPTVSLETISGDTEFYDGQDIVIKTYIQLTYFDENSFYLGEIEKKHVMTHLNIDNVNLDIDSLHKKLKVNLSENNYNRALVLVKGKVQDNCNIEGIISCCFGKTITIKAQEIKQLAPVEYYKRPK